MSEPRVAVKWGVIDNFAMTGEMHVIPVADDHAPCGHITSQVCMCQPRTAPHRLNPRCTLVTHNDELPGDRKAREQQWQEKRWTN